MGHYGCWDGPDAKKILDDAKVAFENFWNFFDKNREKLGDINYLAKTLVQTHLPKSKAIERVGGGFSPKRW